MIHGNFHEMPTTLMNGCSMIINQNRHHDAYQTLVDQSDQHHNHGDHPTLVDAGHGGGGGG